MRLTLQELSASTWFPASAGIYTIPQPEQSQKLLTRKIGHITATNAPAVATSNPGCHLQLANGLKACTGHACNEVTQPVSLLARAYRREKSAVSDTAL